MLSSPASEYFGVMGRRAWHVWEVVRRGIVQATDLRSCLRSRSRNGEPPLGGSQ